MKTLTIDLPESLAQQITAREISQQQLECAIIHMLEAYLKVTAETRGQFGAGADEFARRLIAENPELFARLAKL